MKIYIDAEIQIQLLKSNITRIDFEIDIIKHSIPRNHKIKNKRTLKYTKQKEEFEQRLNKYKLKYPEYFI